MIQKHLAILTQGLQKSYGNIQALRAVDLSVERGQTYGFLGPNGAGKTTTIRCLLDLIRPQAGTVRVLGIDPQADPVAVRARVGYLPGELNLEPNLTAGGTLRYLNELRGRQADWAFVRQLAQRFELDLSIPIRNLSKGNKQKVGVIQAFMARPELLLLDEPTSGLDPLMQQEVYRLIREAQADGATVFFSSHIISEIGAIAQRVAIIRGGVIVEETEPSQLGSMVMRRVRIRFQEPVDLTAVSRVPGVEIVNQNGTTATLRVEGEMDNLLKTLATYPVSDLETERPSLEEIFLAFYEARE
jgi:ABC-2 type transport system ATP-binding protein